MTKLSKKELLQGTYLDNLYSRTLLNRLISRLKDESEIGDFPSDTPKGLIVLVQDILSVIDAHLKWEYHLESLRLTKERSSAREVDRLHERINTATRSIARLVELLKYINGSRVLNNPWRLVGQMEHLCNELIPSAKLIIQPRWDYNFSYSSITRDLREWTNIVMRSDSSLSNAITSVLDKHPYYFSLSFPSIGTDDVLNMAIWAHELGHFVDNVLGEQISQKLGTYLSTKKMERFEVRIQPEIRKMLESIGIENTFDLDEVTIRITKIISDRFENWSKEIFAELFSIRLFGPAAMLAIKEIIHNTESGFGDSVNDSHPPANIRASVILHAYSKWNNRFPDWTDSLPLKVQKAFENEIHIIEHMATTSYDNQSFTRASSEKEISNIQVRRLVDTNLVYVYLQTVIELMEKEIDINVREESIPTINSEDIIDMVRMIKDLGNSIPPLPEKRGNNYSTSKPLILILMAGWLFWITSRDGFFPKKNENYDEAIDLYKDINDLVAKAVEIVEAQRWFDEHNKINAKKVDDLNISGLSGKGKQKVSTSMNKIVKRIEEKNIIFIPLIDSHTQVDVSSIDIRLGNEFIITKLPVVTKLDPPELDVSQSTIQFQTKIYVPFGKPFVLHPGQFVLGSTLEYIGMPNELSALVVGRSSWGRLGLTIATASKIDPGFKGCITLELTNLGNVPIFIYPGSRIGQLIFNKV